MIEEIAACIWITVLLLGCLSPWWVGIMQDWREDRKKERAEFNSQTMRIAENLRHARLYGEEKKPQPPQETVTMRQTLIECLRELIVIVGKEKDRAISQAAFPEAVRWRDDSLLLANILTRWEGLVSRVLTSYEQYEQADEHYRKDRGYDQIDALKKELTAATAKAKTLEGELAEVKEMVEFSMWKMIYDTAVGCGLLTTYPLRNATSSGRERVCGLIKWLRDEQLALQKEVQRERNLTSAYLKQRDEALKNAKEMQTKTDLIAKPKLIQLHNLLSCRVAEGHVCPDCLEKAQKITKDIVG